MIKVKEFPSGLKLVMNRLDGFLSVATGMWVGTGSAFESKSENGISHFIEHMMFKGTTSMSAFEISDKVDSVGGQLNAFTSRETTCYYTWTTKEHVKMSCELLSDMLFNSLFESAELEKEQGVVLEEISMSNDNPEDVCFDRLFETVYGNAGVGQTILGTSENVQSFDKNAIKAYMAKHYSPNNIVLSVVGNIDFDEVEKFARESFETNFKNAERVSQSYQAPTFSQGFVSNTKDIEQCHLTLAMPSIRFNHEKSYEFSMINNILGGGMTSRLFQKIREELGLCYTIYSYNSLNQNSGTHLIYTGINPKNIDLCLENVFKVLVELKKNAITKEEFNRAKEQMKGNMILSQESCQNQMMLAGKYMAMSGEVFNMQERVDRISKITLDGVVDIIQNQMFDFEKISASVVSKEAIDIEKLVKSKLN
ncbi:MAG: pitrilysin family protein [Bacillota bacterium]